MVQIVLEHVFGMIKVAVVESTQLEPQAPERWHHWATNNRSISDKESTGITILFVNS